VNYAILPASAQFLRQGDIYVAVLHGIVVLLQIISAVLLILIIAIQTTKSEQGATGMGWGTIGGQASTSVTKFGLDAQLTRVTTWIAGSFFVLSFLGALLEGKLFHH